MRRCSRWILTAVLGGGCCWPGAAFAQRPGLLPRISFGRRETTAQLPPAPAPSGEPAPSARPVKEPARRAEPPFESTLPILPEDGTAVDGLMTVEALEQLALQCNPTIAQAQAIVRKMRGKQVQQGLYPNPTAGYVGSEIGNEGKAGQEGYFAEQEFVTANKLGLSQAAAAAERRKAECAYVAQTMRVRNAVRREFYAVLTAERLEQLSRELVEIAERSVRITDIRMKRGESNKVDLLQARIEADSARLVLTSAENARHAAWKRLHAVVGAPKLPGTSLAGDLTTDVPVLAWADVWDRLCATSPQLSAARHDVSRAQAALRRAQVEPIPNIVAQGMHQYDNATQYQIAGAQIGVAIPIFNRNQGNISTAHADVTQTHREVQRLERSLERALANAYQEYSTAASQAERYRETILPAAKESLDLSRNLYEAGEISFLQLQLSQRTYTQMNVQYVEVLGRLWQATIAVDGLLLTDGLASPESLEPDDK